MNYDRAAATSLRILTRAGKSVILRFVTPGEYDPETSEAAEPTTQDDPRKIVLLDFSRYNSGRVLKDGTLVQTGDKWGLLSVSQKGFGAPEDSSLIIDGSVTYTIWGVKELNPAGTPLLYDLVLRRER